MNHLRYILWKKNMGWVVEKEIYKIIKYLLCPHDYLKKVQCHIFFIGFVSLCVSVCFSLSFLHYVG